MINTSKKAGLLCREKDSDPEGKQLAATKDPLGEATKLVQKLKQHAPDRIKTHLLAFEVLPHICHCHLVCCQCCSCICPPCQQLLSQGTLKTLKVQQRAPDCTTQTCEACLCVLLPGPGAILPGGLPSMGFADCVHLYGRQLYSTPLNSTSPYSIPAANWSCERSLCRQQSAFVGDSSLSLASPAGRLELASSQACRLAWRCLLVPAGTLQQQKESV